ncbi:UNVERIFIED_CONTAM: hypothetical protein FKN15_025695 [Acipenser sinensis]
MQALEDLDYLAALDDDGNLSEVGIIMSEFPLDPQLAKALIASCEFDCVSEMLTVAAMLTGLCFRLYQQSFHDSDMPDFSAPRVSEENLSQLVLLLKRLDIADMGQCKFLDRPAPEALMQALEDLDYLAALDDDGNLSEVGIIMSEFPLDPQLAKALIASCEFDCVSEMLTVAAMLTGYLSRKPLPRPPCWVLYHEFTISQNNCISVLYLCKLTQYASCFSRLVDLAPQYYLGNLPASEGRDLLMELRHKLFLPDPQRGEEEEEQGEGGQVESAGAKLPKDHLHQESQELSRTQSVNKREDRRGERREEEESGERREEEESGERREEEESGERREEEESGERREEEESGERREEEESGERREEEESGERREEEESGERREEEESGERREEEESGERREEEESGERREEEESGERREEEESGERREEEESGERREEEESGERREEEESGERREEEESGERREEEESG